MSFAYSSPAHAEFASRARRIQMSFSPGNASGAGDLAEPHPMIRPAGSRRAAAMVVAALVTTACGRDSSGPSNGECGTRPATTMVVGAVVSPVTTPSLCVSGGAEYALIPFNASTLSEKVSFDVTATGIGAVGPALSLVPGTSAPASFARLPVDATPGRNAAFEARLRARESELSSLIPAARRRAELRGARSGASRAVIPGTVTIGQLLELNTNSDKACSDPTYRFGRVVAITTRSIVVADTTNPINGFT